MISSGQSRPASWWALMAGLLVAGVIVALAVVNAVRNTLTARAEADRKAKEREAAILAANEAAKKFEQEAIARGVDPAQARIDAEKKRRAALPLDQQIEEFENTVQLADCQRCQQEQPYWGQDIAKPDSFWIDHTKRCLPIKRACNERKLGFNTRPPGRISPPNDYTG